ncbi:aldo/keto reductase [Amaricoccus solimangrovi]|uniref:Aldo/keto reductase n=1 Tax=Amaricoccus solimangrovi TaxID=2589815 RepID=A0A501X103_9RHOB|nr:aldo/keto reductase [Amaricoccus solimangrovi]TPE52936.1 aldo/keto reductase [Amaricoccus solimangrovi]
MLRRRLGAGGPLVSAVGIGAMSFAGVYGEATEAEAHGVLAAALDLGVDHLDTSNIYGMGLSERMIGSFLAKQGKAGRDLFRIATKGGITRDPATGARCFDNSRAHLEAELDGSLRRLGLETVDLYYVHRRDPSLPIEEVTETLAGFVRAGKIRAFGFSEIAPSSLRRAAAVHPVAAVQSEYSLSTRLPELGLIRSCAALGTALVAFSPVGRGLLTDHPPSRAAIDASGFLSTAPRFAEPNYAANLVEVARFQALAAGMGTSAAALAIAWVLARAPESLAIPGTRSVAHLRELVAGAKLTLSEADLARIETTLPAGWAHGDRYPREGWVGPEMYC